MKKFLLLLAVLAWSCLGYAQDYGKKLELTKVPGVDEGAMAVALDGDTLLVGGSKGTLYVFDASQPEKPVLKGKVKALKNIRQLAVRNGIVALVGRQSGLALVDIKDPKLPVLSQYPTIELATGVDLSNDCVFVGNRIYGIETVDMRNPKAPKYLGNMLTDEAQSVKFAGNRVFVGNWSRGRILIADAADPAQLKPIGSVFLDGFGDGVDVQGNLLLASTGHHSKTIRGNDGKGRGHGLELWDIADPAKPVRLSRFAFPRFYNIGNDFWTVRASGNYAFCVDTHNGFFVLDISDRKNPVCIGHAQLEQVKTRILDWDGKASEGMYGDAASSIAVGKDVVYITGLKTGLYLAKMPGIATVPPVENSPSVKIAPQPIPAAPANYANYRPGSQIAECAIAGDVAFLAACEDGIRAVRLGEETITPLKHYPQRHALDLKVRGNRLYVAENGSGIGIYDIGKDGELTHVANAKMSWGLDCQRIWAPKDTDLVVVSDRGGWIFFLDVSDPLKVKEVFRHNQVGLVYSDLMTHDPVGGYLFFNWHNSGYAWYDVTDKMPKLANWKRFTFATHRGGATNFNGRCLAVAKEGYVLFNPNELKDPKAIKVTRVPGLQLTGVPTADGNVVAFVQRRNGEVIFLDLTNPEAPVWLKERTVIVHGLPGSVEFFQHRIVIPGGYAGLYLEKAPRK